MTSIDSKSSTERSSKSAYRRLLVAGACAAIATFAGAQDASAQMVGFMPDIFVDIDEPEPRIQPRGVVRRLQNRGFAEIGRPRFDGQAYVVEATHPGGSRVRLFVDAYDGALLGRRVIGQANPSYAHPPQGRVARAAPGYGWAEEEPGMRPASRDLGGPIPPADIPMPGGRRRDAALGAEPPGAPDAYGANPDGKARPGAAARKNARLTQPQKPALPQAVPAAPEPKIDSSQAARPPEGASDQTGAKTPAETKSPAEAKAPAEARPVESGRDGIGAQGAETTDAARAKAEDGKPDRAAVDAAPRDAAKADRPAADSPRTGETPGASESPTTGAAGPAQVTPAANRKDASETPREQAWKDIEPSKKNVRVIDGATVVPGSEASPSSTN